MGPETFCAQTHQEDDPQERVTFRKLTQMAADMIMAVVLPQGARAVVLFDSYYLCPTVTAACQEADWPFISVAKKNRNFAPEGRPRDRRKVGIYGRNVLQRCGCWQSVGGKRHRVAERVGQLSKAGRVKLVFSQRPHERAWVALVTNETRWGAQTVLRHYFHRWPIEKAQADYPSRRRWGGARRIGCHRRNGVARAGRVVPATPGRSHRRSRMSDTTRRPTPPRA